MQEFVGVDNAQRMLEQSRIEASGYDNVEIIEAELEDLHSHFGPEHFDHTVCVWNTLGNTEDEVTTLKELSSVTKGSIFVTTYVKGTLEQRKNWYETVGIPIKEVDEENEIFYSESGLRSKSYSPEDIQQLAEKAGLTVIETKTLNQVMLWSEISGK